MITKQEANELRIIIDECNNQRDTLDGALNRMHLAKTYEELDKKLHQKVQFMVEHSAQQGGEDE